MSICFNPNNQQFLLNTDHTSYVMELYNGRLSHVYWGSRISHAPMLEHLFPFRFGADFSATDLPGCIINSTDKLPQEFPVFGSADMRTPAFHGTHLDGNSICRFLYESHRIFPGKPSLSPLPATYGQDTESETLEIQLKDSLTGLSAFLSYTVFPQKDVLTRSVRIENNGAEPCSIQKAASCCLDLHDHNYELIHLPGAWARERSITRSALTGGTVSLDSKRGASSHNQNPFFALCRPDTTETSGEVMGFCFVYSGNFSAEVSIEQFGTTRVQMGINPFGFSWQLNPGDVFQTPEVIMVYSHCGLGEMTRRFHKIIRQNLCRGIYRDSIRPVLANNWEATYFDFNEDKIMAIAEKARQIGIDLMVLDDGWFGKRNADNCSLGDWVSNHAKLPNGLPGLAEKVNAIGMKFGLWFEPEMVSPASDLYRTHPDWCIHTPNRPRTEGRNQLILDLARPEVCDYILNVLTEILQSTNISYVKWDMNRNMTEVCNSEQPHRYMLGLYRILETLVTRFPNVLFESCSGGGGRFDAGMLYYMPQTWASDDTDAVERLYIQEGTSLVYPLSTIGAHVSAVPNHQIKRITPLAFRGAVAMMGRFGVELDLCELAQGELDMLQRQISFYKEIEQIVHQGDLYRLSSIYHNRYAAYQIISPFQNTILVFFYSIVGKPNIAPDRIRLQGLDADANYEYNGTVYSGSSLMNIGLSVDTRHDLDAKIYIFKKTLLNNE